VTRWLEAARRASAAGKKPNLLKQPSWREVNSVNSVNSDGQAIDPAPHNVPFDEQACALRVKQIAIPERNPTTALADADGVARSPEAIEAVWDWAEALAHEYHSQNREDIDD